MPPRGPQASRAAAAAPAAAQLTNTRCCPGHENSLLVSRPSDATAVCSRRSPECTSREVHLGSPEPQVQRQQGSQGAVSCEHWDKCCTNRIAQTQDRNRPSMLAGGVGESKLCGKTRGRVACPLGSCSQLMAPHRGIHLLTMPHKRAERYHDGLVRAERGASDRHETHLLSPLAPWLRAESCTHTKGM